MKHVLDETFRNPALDPRLRWLNPPPRWQVRPEAGLLVVEPEAQTDFWQATHYGFRVDNGHVLGLEASGDFTLSTQVAFNPVHQYDQAGLMIRLDASCWIKASVEHELDGPPRLGVVLTSQGYSDWSVQDAPVGTREISLRISKHGSDLTAAFQWPGQQAWSLMRVAHWHGPPDRPGFAGLYACSPKGAGFRADFSSLRLVSGGGE